MEVKEVLKWHQFELHKNEFMGKVKILKYVWCSKSSHEKPPKAYITEVKRSFLKKMFIYFRERDWERESEAGFRLWAVSTEPDVGLEPTNHEIMTWAEVGCLTDWATQTPQKWEDLNSIIIVPSFKTGRKTKQNKTQQKNPQNQAEVIK